MCDVLGCTECINIFCSNVGLCSIHYYKYVGCNSLLTKKGLLISCIGVSVLLEENKFNVLEVVGDGRKLTSETYV